MTAVDLCVALTCYTLVVAVAATAEFLWVRRFSSLVLAAIALVAVAATTVVGFHLKPGTSYPALLWFLVREHDFSALAAGGLGVAAALTWLIRLADRGRSVGPNRRDRSIQHVVSPFFLAASIVGVVFFGQLFIWNDIRGIHRDPVVRMHVPGFVVEKIAQLDFAPIRIAVDEVGHVFVSYDYFEDAGTMGGGIVELSRVGSTSQFQKRIVADSPCLIRCYGLASRNGELFVSRSGFGSTATQGTVSYENLGAITELRDANGDGYFEYIHDVVSGLPGVRGPVTMHQNNGICFAADGTLYVTTANAANRSLAQHPWDGAVLRVSPDFQKTEVFAQGFRNPFGIAIGPDNELFVTDNDIDENPGDELNHVVRGGHYGHPYVVPNEPLVQSKGFRDPIFVGGLESNLLGMAYPTSPNLPEPYRNCLYVADFMQNAILRLKLERSGDTYKVTLVETFATISSPVDIAATPSGEFFVVSRNTKNVYRIRPRSSTVGGLDE